MNFITFSISIIALIVPLIICIFIMILIYLKHRYKIKSINQGKIIEINDSVDYFEDRFPSLIFKNYAVPLKIDNSSTVEFVLPDLDRSGQLQYHFASYRLNQISIPKFEDHKKIIEFRAIDELKNYIKEQIKIEQEISSLEAQKQQIVELARLTAKSDVYANQRETFDKALTEINKLIDKAQQLEKLYISLVKEGLIGVKLSNYNPNLLENNSLSYKTTYEQLRGEYEYMKDTAKAYGDLLQAYHK